MPDLDTLALTRHVPSAGLGGRPGGYHGKSRAARAVAQWHDQDSGHPGAFAFCDQQPCAAVRDVDVHESDDE